MTLVDGKATLALPVLAPGKHSLTAHYQGDSSHLAASSPILAESGLGSGPCPPVLPPPHHVNSPRNLNP